MKNCKMVEFGILRSVDNEYGEYSCAIQQYRIEHSHLCREIIEANSPLVFIGFVI